MEIELTQEEKQLKINSPTDLYPILQKVYLRENMIARGREHFWVVGLSPAGILLYLELVALGRANMVMVNVGDVLRFALIKGATTIIGAHNHPSKSLKISNEDQELTGRIIGSAAVMDIHMADHLIITEDSYCSLSDKGLMEAIREDIKSKPGPHGAELRAFEIRKEVREEFNGKILTIAEKLLRKNTPVEEIADIVSMEPFDLKVLLGLDIPKSRV